MYVVLDNSPVKIKTTTPVIKVAIILQLIVFSTLLDLDATILLFYYNMQ